MEGETGEDFFNCEKENEQYLMPESRLRRRSRIAVHKSRPTSYPPCFSVGAFNTPMFVKGGLMDRKPQKLIEPICEEVSARIGRKVKFADEAGKQLASYIEIPSKFERFGFRSLTNINSIFEEVMGKDLNEIEQVFDSAFSVKQMHRKPESRNEHKESTDSSLGCKRKYNPQSHVSFPKEKFPRAQTGRDNQCNETEPAKHTLHQREDHSPQQNVKVRKHSLDGWVIGESEEENNSSDASGCHETMLEHSDPQKTTEQSIMESDTSLAKIEASKRPPSDTIQNAPTNCGAGGNIQNIPHNRIFTGQEIPILHHIKGGSSNFCIKTHNNMNVPVSISIGKSNDAVFEEMIKKLHSAGQSSGSSSESNDGGGSMISPTCRPKGMPVPVFHNQANTHQDVNNSLLPEMEDYVPYSPKCTNHSLSVHEPVSDNNVNIRQDDRNEELSFTVVLKKEHDSELTNHSDKDMGMNVDYTFSFEPALPNNTDKETNIMTSSFDENPNISFTIISPTPSSADVPSTHDLQKDSSPSHRSRNQSSDIGSPSVKDDFITQTNAAIADILSVFDDVSFPDFKDQPHCIDEFRETQIEEEDEEWEEGEEEGEKEEVDQEDTETQEGVEGKQEQETHDEEKLSCCTCSTTTNNLEAVNEYEYNNSGMLAVCHGSESGYGTHSFISDDFFNDDALSVGTNCFELDDVFEEESSSNEVAQGSEDKPPEDTHNEECDITGSWCGLMFTNNNSLDREDYIPEVSSFSPIPGQSHLTMNQCSSPRFDFAECFQTLDEHTHLNENTVRTEEYSDIHNTMTECPLDSHCDHDNYESDRHQQEITDNKDLFKDSEIIVLNSNPEKFTCNNFEKSDNCHLSNKKLQQEVTQPKHDNEYHEQSNNIAMDYVEENHNGTYIQSVGDEKQTLELSDDQKFRTGIITSDIFQEESKQSAQYLENRLGYIQNSSEQNVDAYFSDESGSGKKDCHHAASALMKSNYHSSSGCTAPETNGSGQVPTLSSSTSANQNSFSFGQAASALRENDLNPCESDTMMQIISQPQTVESTGNCATQQADVHRMDDSNVESSDMEVYMPKNMARAVVDCMFRKKAYHDDSDSDSGEVHNNVNKTKIVRCKPRRENSLTKRSKPGDKSCRKNSPSIRIDLIDNNSGDESDIESFNSEDSQVEQEFMPKLPLLIDKRLSPTGYFSTSLLGRVSPLEDLEYRESTSASSPETNQNIGNRKSASDHTHAPLKSLFRDDISSSDSANNMNITKLQNIAHSGDDIIGKDYFSSSSLSENVSKKQDLPTSGNSSERSVHCDIVNSPQTARPSSKAYIGTHSSDSPSSNAAETSDGDTHSDWNRDYTACKCDTYVMRGFSSNHQSCRSCGGNRNPHAALGNSSTGSSRKKLQNSQSATPLPSETCVDHIFVNDRPFADDVTKPCRNNPYGSTSPSSAVNCESHEESHSIKGPLIQEPSYSDHTGVQCEWGTVPLGMEGPCVPSNINLHDTVIGSSLDESNGEVDSPLDGLPESNLLESLNENELNITVIITSEGKLIVQDEQK